jgi:hypothetical protein
MNLYVTVYNFYDEMNFLTYEFTVHSNPIVVIVAVGAVYYVQGKQIKGYDLFSFHVFSFMTAKEANFYFIYLFHLSSCHVIRFILSTLASSK